MVVVVVDEDPVDDPESPEVPVPPALGQSQVLQAQVPEQQLSVVPHSYSPLSVQHVCAVPMHVPPHSCSVIPQDSLAVAVATRRTKDSIPARMALHDAACQELRPIDPISA